MLFSTKLLGSFEGILRVYRPKASRGFLASDMIIEKNVGLPILQVETGKFNPQSPGDFAIALLHSRKLTVAAVT